MFDSNGVEIASAVNLETCLRWHSNGSEIILHILVHIYVMYEYGSQKYNWQVNLLFDAIFAIEVKQNLCKKKQPPERCSITKGVLKSFAKSLQKTCARVFFLIKLQAWGLELYITKETLTQVFSSEFCEIFKNTFLQNTLWRLLL